MKIRIEGCTAEELAEYSPYLSLGKVYEAVEARPGFVYLTDDQGSEVRSRMPHSMHLPNEAKWVEVTE